MLFFGKFSKDRKIEELEAEVERLTDLCEEKDEWMDAVASDALRKGSSLGAKVLADKKEFLKEKKK